MFEFIKVQLTLGCLTLEQAKGFVGKFITEEEYQKLEKQQGEKA